LEIKLHRFQQDALFSDKRITSLVAGKQGGKTFIGSIWARMKASLFKEPKDCGIITAPTHKILKQATLPRLLQTFDGLGKWRESDSIYEMRNGQPIYVRTMHDVNTIEGITRCRWIWGDEAGQYKAMAWDNIQGRAAPMEADIFLTTTPYALNWLYKDLYRPWSQGKRDDVRFVQFRSIDNPYFPPAEYERLKKIMDPRIFAMHFEGRFQQMAGLVYPEIDEVKNYEDPFGPNPRDYFICAGVDFGFTNPFAVSIRAIHRKQARDYQVGEFYKTGLLLDDMVRILGKMQTQLGVEVFYADSAEPRTIADLSARGIRIVGAAKGPDSLKNGISVHGELIRTCEYKMFRGKCPHTEDEYSTYHYPEDKGLEINFAENPVDANNHLMNANMYVSSMTKEFRRSRAEQAAPVLVKNDLEELLSGEWAQKTFGRQVGDDWYNG
jgi:phage terminase large subunit